MERFTVGLDDIWDNPSHGQELLPAMAGNYRQLPRYKTRYRARARPAQFCSPTTLAKNNDKRNQVAPWLRGYNSHLLHSSNRVQYHPLSTPTSYTSTLRSYIETSNSTGRNSQEIPPSARCTSRSTSR